MTRIKVEFIPRANNKCAVYMAFNEESHMFLGLFTLGSYYPAIYKIEDICKAVFAFAGLEMEPEAWSIKRDEMAKAMVSGTEDQSNYVTIL